MFDDQGLYKGPLPRISAPPMQTGPEHTTKTAEYPPALNEALARMIVKSCRDWMDNSANPLEGGGASSLMVPSFPGSSSQGDSYIVASSSDQGDSYTVASSLSDQGPSAVVQSASAVSGQSAGQAVVQSASAVEGQSAGQHQYSASPATYTKASGELHEALGLKGAGNAEAEGFFVSTPGEQYVCIEVRAAEHGNTTSEDDEPGVKKPFKYHGRIGRGKPIVITQAGKKKEFHDGAGLCSPGRWHPRDRRECALSRSLHDSLMELLDANMDVLSMACRLAHGGLDECPFGSGLLGEGRRRIFRVLQVDDAGSMLQVAERQPFLLNLASLMARVLGDPDWRVLVTGPNNFTRGVQVGVDEKLPRTPAVYDRKIKWRRYDPADLILEEKSNYKSARLAKDSLRKQFEAEVELGMMVRTTMAAARKKYGDRLRVAPQGALAKGDGSHRPLHDGTHGPAVNPNLKARDQLRNPGGGELRHVLADMSGDPAPSFGLTADISKAHRRYKHKEEDWGLMACRLEEEGEELFLNCVGTYGIGCASYWWSRLFGVFCRISLAVSGRRPLWQLLFADDVLWLAKGGSWH